MSGLGSCLGVAYFLTNLRIALFKEVFLIESCSEDIFPAYQLPVPNTSFHEMIIEDQYHAHCT